MRYIEKHFDAANVVQHEDELERVQLDEASLVAKKQIENLNGKELYKQIRSTEFIPHWRSLQDQLNIDQGACAVIVVQNCIIQIVNIIVLSMLVHVHQILN